MNPSAQALTDYMSELSEQAYSAGWMQGLEFALWEAIEEGPRHYGHLDITSDHISKLRTLSDVCGSWIVFDVEIGQKPISLDEWRKAYAHRITSMKSKTLQSLSTKQFIGGTVLVTIAFALLMVNQGKLSALFSFPLLIANFVMMPPDIRKRPITRNDLLISLAAVLATAAFIAWCISHPTPSSDSSARSFSHPTVAVPLSLGFVYLLYRRWCVKPPLKDDLPSEHSRQS